MQSKGIFLELTPGSYIASKLRRGVTFFRKWTMIRIYVCNAWSMSEFRCKTLMNRHHMPSTCIQTISNTIFLIYAYQWDKSTIKAKFFALIFWIELNKNTHKFHLFSCPLPHFQNPNLLHTAPLISQFSCSFLSLSSGVCYAKLMLLVSSSLASNTFARVWIARLVCTHQDSLKTTLNRERSIGWALAIYRRYCPLYVSLYYNA